MSESTPPPENTPPSTGDGTPPPPPSPPSGGYDAPAPPPPAGGYGAPPPPAQYGAPGGYQQPFSATDAFSYGWNKFKDNAGPMVAVTACTFGVIIAVMAVMMGVMAAAGAFASSTSVPDTSNCDPASPDYFDCISQGSTSASTTFSFGFMALMMLAILVAMLAAVIFQAAAYKGALLIVDGHKPSLGDMFKGWSKGQVFGSMALMWVIVMIGMVLCYIPGIIASFLLLFAPVFAVDNEGGSVLDPLKRSFEIVKNNIGGVLLLWLLTFVVVLVGELLCFVGLLAAMPIAFIATAYAARKLEGRPVAP